MGFLSNLLHLGKSSNSDTASSVVANAEPINADITLYAPVNGTLLPLEEVPDIVVSERVLGEGVAVAPESETIVAPCDGVISRILPTKNGFAVKMAQGLEVYVGFGIESMEMKGEGFTLKVNVGDEVKRGDPVIITDQRLLSKKLKSTITSMVAIRSTSNIDKVINASGKCMAGYTPVVWINLKQPA